MKGTSLFAQIIAHAIHPTDFNSIVRTHNGDKHAKGFRCWDQLVSMLFLHFSKSTSLREITGGIRSCAGKISHLRMNQAPNRSTLSYANAHRDWRIYRDTFFLVLNRCRGVFHGTKPFQFKNKLLSVDSTVLDLSVTLFDWAKFRQTKGAVKVHMLLDHDGYLPIFASIGEGKGSDSMVLKKSMLPIDSLLDGNRFPRGSILVMDRAYVDFQLFSMLAQREIFFVTRLKEGMNWVVVEKREVPKNRNILRDDIISFQSQKAIKLLGQHNRFRLVESLDTKTGEVICLLSNHLSLGPTTISGIYRDRWSIGVSRKGHITKSVKVRPRIKDPNLVAWEVPWRETKTAKPSDNVFYKENMQHSRPQRTVNAEVASLHATPVAETVYNARRQQGLTERGLIRQSSPAGYQRWHVVKDYVETGEALDTRRRNIVEEANPITLNGKWMSRYQGDGLGGSTDDRRAAKRARRKGPRLMSIPFDQSEAGVR